MQEIGKNAYFINIDVHTDKHKLKEQYEVQTIPSFVKVDDSGKVLAKIHSGEWEQNIVSDIAPVMDKLINKNAYDLNREQYIDGWF